MSRSKNSHTNINNHEAVGLSFIDFSFIRFPSRSIAYRYVLALDLAEEAGACEGVLTLLREEADHWVGLYFDRA